MVDQNCGDFALAARASLRLRTALVATPGFWLLEAWAEAKKAVSGRRSWRSVRISLQRQPA
jgi:hypothetical protein